MSTDTKTIFVNVKDLSFKSEEHVEDLIRYISEALPRIEVTRNGNELEVVMPNDLSQRALRLRIRKFLYKRNLKEDYRPVSLNSSDKKGYAIKEKKEFQFTYY